MKKNILLHKILAVFCDLIIAGVLLCTFALFHHVIPQKGNTENAISIPKPTASIPAFSLPDINTPQVHTPTISATITSSATNTISTTPKATATFPYTAEKTSDLTTPSATPTARQTDAETPEPTVVQTPSVIQTENSYRSNNVVINMRTEQTDRKSVV